MNSLYKKIGIAGCIVGALICGSLGKSEAAAVPTISLMINGKGVKTDVAPMIRNQRMYVPIRVISEHTNAAVNYSSSTQEVGIKQGNKKIRLWIGSKQATVNGQRITLDGAPFISKKRTYVPIRFISQSLGHQVTWDSRAKVAKVTSQMKEGAILHRVATGESLWKISYQYGISVDRLQAANPSTGTELLAGTQLLIPSVGHVQNAPYDKKNSYVVQPKDTLSAIAKTHQTTVELIKKNNPSISANLIVGQILYLPNGAKRSRHSLEGLLFDKQLLRSTNRFPLSAKSSYEPVVNTFGDGRTWNATTQDRHRVHEGIDLMTQKGTPVYSVTNGTVHRLGWNRYGGYRINILDSSGKYHWYYAHLEAYTPALKQGDYVKAGQLIGFVGDTGYGAKGTTGKFAAHLHFGMYYSSTGKATNPYFYLKYWEQQKIQTY